MYEIMVTHENREIGLRCRIDNFVIIAMIALKS